MSKRRGRAGQRSNTRVPNDTGYAVFLVRSGYSSDFISAYDGSFRCKKLDYPVDFYLRSSVYDSMDDLLIGCCRGMPALQTRLDRDFAEPEAEPETVVTDDPEASETESESDGLRQRITELEEQLSRTMEERDAEVERLLSENKALSDTVEGLRIENSELETTKNHFAKEARFARQTDVHGIMESVLEFMASVNNTVTDNEASDEARQLVSIYTERLIMALSSKGIKVTKHDRGEPLDDGRLEIMEQETEDPSLDMRVARSVRYGCTFSDGIHPAVPEDLTVYVYKGRQADAETAESREFRLRAVDDD